MLKKQQLYQQLKQDIQLQHWAPGTVLTQQHIAQYYAVSRIVVRDAQQRLMSEGWLKLHGKAGMQVPGFSAAEAQELCLLRLQLEPLALECAAPRLNFTLLGQAEDVLQRLNKQPDLPAYQRGALNWQFHRLLYQGCEKPHLLRLLDQLHQQVARYLGFQEQALRYHDTSDAEHLQLLDLLRQHKTAAAIDLLCAHIQTASDGLVQYLKAQKAP